MNRTRADLRRDLGGELSSERLTFSATGDLRQTLRRGVGVNALDGG